ncbi:unnamed protein product [Symbiodinium sp. CCMP2592]|nr:unnamed protein product [Symbiodinium sp. CCMP2592]
MDQFQEVFGPLVEAQLYAMEWTTPRKGSGAQLGRKASRTEQGKAATHTQTTLAQRWGQRPFKGHFKDGPNITYLIKALARLALQQETAIKILRQDYSWVLFIQPDNQGPLPLLFKAAQKWKKAQEEAKAEEMKWLKDGHWCYPQWSPALGSLVVDEDRPPLPLQHTKLVALQLVLPLIMLPYMIHRFHPTRPLAGNMTGMTSFELDISSRTKGNHTAWDFLEALTGLSALQIIGLQLRRDTLKQSLAAGLVQQALAEFS